MTLWEREIRSEVTRNIRNQFVPMSKLIAEKRRPETGRAQKFQYPSLGKKMGVVGGAPAFWSKAVGKFEPDESSRQKFTIKIGIMTVGKKFISI